MPNTSIFTAVILVFIVLSIHSAHAQVQKGNAISGDAEGDVFGWSVSMPNSRTLAIGERSSDANGLNSGRVRIYEWVGETWMQKGSAIHGEAVGDGMGFSVSMPTPTALAVGARFNAGNGQDAGHVKVFTWNGNSWIQKGNTLEGEAPGDFSGSAISMPNENTIAIGAPNNNGNGTNAGHVRVFTWDGNTWIQKGADIDGEAANDLSGGSVSMPDANTLAIGASQNDGNGLNSGHVRVYRWDGNSWIQKGQDIDGESAYDESGWSVTMPDSNTLAVGAPANSDVDTLAGQVRIFNWNGSSWVQKGSDLDGDEAVAYLGVSVDMPNVNTVAVGAPLYDGNGVNSGLVRIYEWNGSAWAQKGTEILGESAMDEAGFSISVPDSSTIVVGAIGNSMNGQRTGQVRVFDLCKSVQSLEVVECESSYTVPSGNATYFVNGIYQDTLVNKQGCDSILTIDLTIQNVDTAVTVMGTSLQANAQNATYQWLDCVNNFSAIPNANGRIFNPSQNGSYAVEVTQLSCVDTSQCFSMANVGIDEGEDQHGVRVYPNPTNNQLTVEVESPYSGAWVRITNAMGQLVQEKQLYEVSSTFELPWVSGWYIVAIHFPNRVPVYLKVLKQ